MSVSSPFIHRPIATSLLGLATVLGGALGYFNLPVSSLPQVDFPTIQVTTQLPGANPQTMSTLVTASLERELGQIPALSTMTSTSAYGLSQITLQFNLGRDIDAAAQDVQSAINAAGSTLPRNLPYPPTYSKVNPADTAIVTLALTSDSVSMRELSDLADTLIAQRLSTVTGVGHVSVEGGIRPAVRIDADVTRLASYGLSMTDLSNAIVGANVAGPKGSLDGALQSYTIAANDQITSAEAYRDIVVAYRNDGPVRLRDIATVEDGLENVNVGGWYNGTPAVIVDVQRQPGANVIETVDRLKAELPRLKRALPPSVKLTLVHDRTGTIRASIHDVQFTLCLSVGLVVLVVFLFLRSMRATIIAGVALPVSLVATFGVMWFCGFSLDNLSLMALTIGTGFVVDDAIVMIENIVRHLEKGAKPLQAALQGAREIGFTVISLTMSLIAVFIPLLFMTGLVGRMFSEFALTLTIAVVVSAIVSLTLTPMMCAQLLKRHGETKKPVVSRASGIDGVVELYRITLDWVLRHQPATLLVTCMTLAITVWLYVIAPKGFLPDQDTGLVTAVLEAEPQVSFAELSRVQQQVAEDVKKDPAVLGVVAVAGVGTLNTTPNLASLKITLKPRDERTELVGAIVKRLTKVANAVPGVTVFFQSVPDVQIATRTSRAQYQYTLVSTDAAEVDEWSKRLATELKQSPVLKEVTLETQDGGLRAHVEVDRVMAGRLGVTLQTVTLRRNNPYAHPR
jgi:multidrug efflux pump